MAGYTSRVLIDSPYAYWRMERSTTTPQTIINVGTEGTAYSGIVQGVFDYPAGAANNGNECTRFNGINSGVYCDAPEPASPPATAFTVEFWMNFDRVAGEKSLPESILMKGLGTPGSWDADFYVGLNADNKLHAVLKTTTNETDTGAVLNYNLNINTWYLVHVVFKSTSIDFYINGSLVQSSVITNSDFGNLFDNTMPMRMGNFDSSLSAHYLHFKGELDEVALYDYELSASKIYERYQFSDLRNLAKLSNVKELNHAKRIKIGDIDFGLPYMARNYERIVRSRGPLCYWKFKANDGENLGASGATNDLTYAHCFWHVQGFADICDNSVQLNGTTAHMKAGTLGAGYTLGDFSIDFWVSPEETISSGAERTIFYKGAYSATTDIVVTLIADNKIKVKVGATEIISDTSLLEDNWAYVAFTCDGSNWNLYINGVLDKTLSTSTTVSNSASTYMSIGVPVNSSNVAVTDASYTWFLGSLDEMSIVAFPLSSLAIFERYKAGLNQIPLDDFDSVDVSPVYSSIVTYSRDEFLTGLDPTHWWKFDEVHPVPSNLFVDSGSGGRDLTYTLPASNNIVTSPLSGAVGNAREFTSDDSREARNTNGLNVGSVGEYLGFSMSFWYKPVGPSVHEDGLISWATPGTNGGFAVTQHYDTIRVRVYRGATTHTLEMTNVLTENTWHHIGIAIDSAGRIKGFIDGIQYGSVTQITDNKGLLVPPTSTFEIGNQGYDTRPESHFDELMVFAKELTASEFNQIYNLDKYGQAFSRRTISSDPSSVIANPYIPCSQYSEFKNLSEITDFVLEYSTESNIDEVIGAGFLSLSEDFGESALFNKAQPNAVVIIEERFFSQNRSVDTGWVKTGTYLANGPATLDMDAQGNKRFNVPVFDVTKLLSLDFFTRDIEPDIVDEPKEALVVAEPVVDTYKFKKLREGYTLTSPVDPEYKFLQNWTDEPVPKISLTNFTNLYSGSDETKKNADVSPNDQIRLKGGEGAVQILYGEGALVIDRDYYESSIPEIGLGFPNTTTGVLAEFRRYLTYPDLQRNVTISALDYESTGKYAVSMSGLDDGVYANWTVLVKSGNAKGNFYKLKLKNLTRSTSSSKTFGVSANDATSGTKDWTNTGNSIDSNPASAATYNFTALTFSISGPPFINGAVGTYTLTAQGDSKYLKITDIDGVSDIPDSAEILGLELVVKHSTKKFRWYESANNTNRTLQIPTIQLQPSAVRVVKNGTISSTNVASSSNSYWTDIKANINLTDPITKQSTIATSVYGGVENTWGETMTGADIKNANTGFVIQLPDVSNFTSALKVTDTLNQIYQLFETDGFKNIEIYDIKVNVVYKLAGEVFYLTDLRGRPANPVADGLQVGDEIQVGDCNRLEDVLRKIFLPFGFQESDSSKPFYLDIQETNVEILIPPLRSTLSDQRYAIDVLEEVMEYAPPNYNMLVGPDGNVTFKNIVIPNDPVAHDLTSIQSEAIDYSDFSLFTRVVGQGLNLSSVNVALHSDYGGQSAVHAYKRDNFADADDSGLDYSNDLPSANALVKQVVDPSPKNPFINYDDVDIYGTLYQKVGKDVNRWTMEETDLFCIDLGLNNSQQAAQEFEIDRMEFVFYNTFREGSVVNQTLYVYVMTEDDYVAEFNSIPPAIPNQTQADSTTGYMPTSDAQSWKLLTNEISLQEGLNVVDVNQFITGRPEKFRFVKIRVGQPQFRFEVEGKFGGKKFSRINLADIKIWTSNRILASAELGVSNQFAGVEYKDLARRLRRRTYLTPLNPYLNSYEDTLSFAEKELLERSAEFTPHTVEAFAPFVRAGEIVTHTSRKTNTQKRYLVRSVSQSRISESNQLSTIMILENFDIEFN